MPVTMNEDPMLGFLHSAKEAKLDVRRHRRRVALLRSQCEQISSRMTATPNGGTDHGKEELWAALSDAKTEETGLVKKALGQHRAVETFIDGLPDPRYRSILRLRYLEGLGWTRLQFALREEGIYYSERQLRRLHAAALTAARAKWGQREESIQ